VVVDILQIYSWVNGSQILTHDPCDPSRSVDQFDHDPLTIVKSDRNVLGIYSVLIMHSA